MNPNKFLHSTGERARVALLAVGILIPALLSAQGHPRLLFGPEDIPVLRERITRSPYDHMFELLKADAETGQYRSYSGPTPEEPDLPSDPYGECVNAVRLGFLYVLTGDDYYANRARFYVERRINDQTVHRWANSSQKGLNLYYNGKSVALVYDWCHGAPSWDSTFAAQVSAALLAQGNVIADSGGTEQNNNSASNWQGLRGSSAVLCFLAGDEPYDASRYNSMYTKTRNYLRDNLGTDPLSRGWNIEGIGYLGYPYATVIPAAIAAERANASNDMTSGLAAMDYALWTQYAATVRFLRGDEVWLLHPDFGDDNATADDANGMYGAAFAFSKPELIPGLLYWYERLLVPEDNFDYTRGGTIFSILYYPENIDEVAPLEIPAWREGFIDRGGNGFFTYRNQYEDENDMVAQMYLKLRGNKGHSGPDALTFRILGLNTAWAVGGGRYGPKTNGQDVYWRSQNTLYPVDPDARLSTNANSGSIVGTPVIDALGGGSVVSRIGRNNVGTSNHQRWFAADHSRAAGVEAVYVVADTSNDGFFWQFNTLDENSIEETPDGFIVHGQDGATLKATFLYPTGEALSATIGNRIRGSKFAYGLYGETNNFYHLRGSGDYLAVFTVAKAGQIHPPVSLLQGRVVPSILEVGSTRIGLTENSVVGDPPPLILPDAPARVTGLSATASSHFREAVLVWNGVLGASSYIIERADGEGNFVPVGKVPGASTTVDNNLQAGMEYHYRVVASNEAGDAEPSAVATVRIPLATTSPYIAVESFEDYPVGSLGGNNGAGGWQAAWSYGDTAVVDVSAQPLSANGISGGNHAIRLGWGDDIGRRIFANGIASNGYGDGVWFSYLLRWQSGTASQGDKAWIFNTVGNRDWAFAGLSDNGGMRVSDYYAAGNTAPGAIAPGQTVQVVVKVTSAKIELWLNPQSDLEVPLVSYNNSNSKGWRAGFPGLGISNRSDKDDDIYMDRIVVGRSFAAVMALPGEASPYDTWKSSFVWKAVGDDLPGADPDGDGIANKAEFAHGTDPLTADRQPLFLENMGDGNLRALVRLRSEEALEEIVLQQSGSLSGNWTEVDSASANFVSLGLVTYAVIPLGQIETNESLFIRTLYP